MTQKGRGIFLGRPIGTPTGLCIGRPGLMIFKSTRPGLVITGLSGSLIFSPAINVIMSF